MSAWVKVGAKCVCIYEGLAWDNQGIPCEWSADKGRVYTIVSTRTGAEGHLFLGLWGMPLDTFHDVDGFRPLTPSTQEQDVALFKSLLQPAVHDALALVWRDQ